MYSGVEYPVFLIYESDGVTRTQYDGVDAEISFPKYITNRKDSTPFTRIYKQWENPFTREITDKFIGYRYSEEITIYSPHCNLDIDEYLNKQSDPETEYEIHSLIRLVDYQNAGNKIKLIPHYDTIALGTYNEFWVHCELSDWGSKSISGRMDWGVLKITSVDILDSIMLPMPILPPTLLTPSNGSTITTRNVPITWDPPPIYDTFDVRVGILNPPTDALYHAEDLTGTSHSFTDVNSNTYNWQMRTKKGSEYSDWSSVKSFTLNVFKTAPLFLPSRLRSSTIGKFHSLTRLQISLWINITDITTTYFPLVNFNTASSEQEGGLWLSKELGVWYVYGFVIGVRPGSNWKKAVITTGGLNHIFYDFSSAFSPTLRLYVNNVLGAGQAGTTQSATASAHNAYDLEVSRNLIFQGKIDNLKINRVSNFWSDTDKTNEYRSGSGAGTDQIIAEHQWSFESYSAKVGDPTKYGIVYDTGSLAGTQPINLNAVSGYEPNISTL